MEPNSDRVEVVFDQLKAEGFTSDQLPMVDTTLRESGLNIDAAERCIDEVRVAGGGSNAHPGCTIAP